ncbi:MAG: selenocysteine-specific translation elongation factor [Anaerolineae bacterium]|jgi:selenocysteine-specific elongation factor
MHVIATAGHVDHGKSALVEALTGINPDRLQEEKERKMTIDLGFAWLTLPNGESVGIVDVPGHRDFIENMLAGMEGIDASLFVVAADEGVMPQTREHLAILDLLGISNGVIAVTKVDLVKDPDWLDLVVADVAGVVEGTVLEEAPILSVSARTGRGMDDLLAALQEVLEHVEPHADQGRPRLWVDRVFTVSGFGTVVTGTLIDSSLEVGREVEVLPQGLQARIRGLETHKKDIQKAVPGSRVAINLSGISKNDISRGSLVTVPEWLQPTDLVDVQLKYLAAAQKPLKHNTSLKFFCGSAEVMARVRLLGQQALAPNTSGWLQLELTAPLPLVRGDRFIVRRPSPPATVGGGVVVDPHPGRKHRRFHTEVIDQLETLAQGTPGEVLLQTLRQRGPLLVRDLLEIPGLEESAPQALEELLAHGEAAALDADGSVRDDLLVAAEDWWEKATTHAEKQLSAYHQRHPLRPGMGREELRSALRLNPATFSGLIDRAAEEGLLVDEGATIRLPEHQICLTPEQQQAVDDLLESFRRAPYTTPSVKESITVVGEDVLAVLLSRGSLIQVSANVLFLPSTYEEMGDRIRARIQQEESITLAETRDMFDTSRKYAQALLEHLDAEGVTRRVGDKRVLA